ncbi:MAG: outer membrane lipoprotein carrier protein LolA [Bacteroides sp.]|nr:outer membrane lipoprotein carrier protein LolA [Bacteroides sp.]MCM1448312.1 outer membrane lipoprotein carrier protein LolA [Bacteroides sp.]
MKKTILTLFLMLAGTLVSVAAPLTPQQKQKIVTAIGNSVSGLKSMKCTFVQTKSMSMLNDRMVSYGTMHYGQPDKFRWEYTRPYSYLFIFNGAKVYVGNNSKKNVIDVSSNKLFREIAGIMMSTVTGKALTDMETFSLDIEEVRTSWHVTLVPKKKELKRMFQKVVLVFNRTDTAIAGVEIYEKNGDKTEIRMSDVTKNAAIDEAVFTIPF